MAKAAYWTVTDVEDRKRGEQTGLDTLVVLSLIHISEPTRPLYISYAVFCLKKKKTLKTTIVKKHIIVKYTSII